MAARKMAATAKTTKGAKSAPAPKKAVAAGAKKKAAKTGGGATVTLKQLGASLAESHDMPKRQVETILGDMIGMMVDHLKGGDRLRIGGLGILQVRERAARMGRNPATGEQIQIPASRKIAFRASKELKAAV